MNLNEKLEKIKSWLETGSLNIFGLPMSGKDTVGMRLAEDLQAKFLSSGIIIRAYEAEQNDDMTGSGKLIPTNTFYDIILPYFSREELSNDSLVLSSVGRWSGEEDKIMEAAKAGGHEIKAVVMLDLTEEEVKNRFEAAKILNDRGERADDSNIEVFETRLAEFREKTMPVLNHYDELKMLVKVPAIGSRDEVYTNVIDRLVEFIDSL
ncbi:adenylate kinase [Candidatus Nanosyncoccus nanoralicus]|uniref:Adenylate kinase n=2 Tax=Candidatus Nanosyncoccus nanoralicus TaxID=2171996 RepID=A0ABY0FKS8_9BACT|nr:adenylate kinase [Candidatus Nanosyncoccus nanoralicus]